MTLFCVAAPAVPLRPCDSFVYLPLAMSPLGGSVSVPLGGTVFVPLDGTASVPLGDSVLVLGFLVMSEWLQHPYFVFFAGSFETRL